ncbi:MAG: guanylate kinase [Veillonella sp.]|uniref:guanylate kinase n=1 Tax=Veillonella sp. TaxID=1926307 RepID=UPI0025F97290|nr:guanylate kinase [Veillonella sp.]MBS4912701.1 guanylate kinase [Veillonella sp.]
MSDRGILIVLSGPSGAGKGTICSALRKEMPNLVYSVSMTTRAPRVGEEEGVSYFFRDKEEFQRLIEEDAFLEYAKVYDNYYGTPKQHVMNLLSEGKSVILEIDIQGAMQVKERFSEAVFIYIVPPSLDILSTRLRDRGTDATDVINKRLSKASSELALAHRYDYIVVNDVLPDAVEKVASILRAEACRIKRNKEKIQYIYNQYRKDEV